MTVPRIAEILEEILDLPPDRRSARMDAVCAGDDSLRVELEALLAADAAAGSFLSGPLVAPAARPAGAAAVAPRVAWSELRSIGPYRLVQELGSGGMGRVFLARQTEPVERTVAIKVVLETMEGAAAYERFRAERRALARLNHPYIAQLYDANATPEGHPYFVMEHVDGEPITTYCDRLGLGPVERVELLRKVCLGVELAHLKGILHRDLKPANVLVTEIQGSPVPKIIDFGIARALDLGAGDDSWPTQGFLGTPGYVAPELIAPRGGAVGPAADVYTLGVLLYELLVGVPPFRLRNRGGVDLLRVARQDPPAPAERLRRLAAPRREALAAARRLSPEQHLELLRSRRVSEPMLRAIERHASLRTATAAGLARVLVEVGDELAGPCQDREAALRLADALWQLLDGGPGGADDGDTGSRRVERLERDAEGRVGLAASRRLLRIVAGVYDRAGLESRAATVRAQLEPSEAVVVAPASDRPPAGSEIPPRDPAADSESC